MRLRNLFLAFLLFILGPCTAYSAWLFDGTNDYVTLADNAALTLPDGDWTVAGWFKLTSTSWGGDDQNIIEQGNGAVPKFRLALFSYDSVSVEEIYVDIRDDDGTTLLIDQDPGGNWTADTNWNHLVVQRSGTTITIYVNGSSIDSASVGSIDAINPSDTFYFGARGGASSKWFNGTLAEWAKWDRALSAAERAALSAGFSPNCFPGFSWFTPMVGGAYQELANGITTTNNGTVSASHPRMYSCN